MKQIILTIDNDVLNRYTEFYFSIHTRAYKKPIEHPYHPSINKWMIMQRQAMNSLKQKWKDFIIWFITDLGYEDMQIKKCTIEYITYMPTKRRSDPDNYTPKFINDGLVEAGFLVDDSDENIRTLSLSCRHDKDNPRTEIIVNILEEKR